MTVIAGEHAPARSWERLRSLRPPGELLGPIWACVATCLAACVGDSPSPFDVAGGSGGAAVTVGPSSGEGGEGGEGGEVAVDPTLGGPCTDDSPCNDGADCTLDACDLAIGRCRFTPDDAPCANGIHCDGVEKCTPRIGCEPSTPVDCGDDDACSIDTCDEPTQTCRRKPRDADGDGDPDGHCAGGADCDDIDPTRSSLAPEVCDNQRDDDCDGDVDEIGCVAAAHDDCDDALEISGTGVFTLQTAGSVLDVGASCASETAISDVFGVVTLADGPSRDIELRLTGGLGDVTVAVQTECGEGGSEIACGPSASNPDGDPVARTIARSLEPGSYAVVVTTSFPEAVTLDVRIGPATSAPDNETCGTAQPVSIDTPVAVTLVDATEDVGTACPRQTGELVYRFDLEESVDVDVYADTVDGGGAVSVSLRDEDCALPEDELVCATSLSPHLYRGALDAGTWFLAVSATAPTDATFFIDTSPPTERPDDETCEGAPVLRGGEGADVDFALHQDDHHPCITGAADAAYEIELQEISDVLLVAFAAPGDTASIALTGPACGDSDLVSCSASGQFPSRLRRRGLTEGSWFALLESLTGVDQRFDVWARPAAPPISVPFADACGAAQSIPPGGGFFTGNTTSAAADFGAGCDDAGGGPGGAPDRLLRLDLDAPARVVLDMSGTTYDALLDVRRGPDCPGTEVPLGCTVSSGNAGAPYLDLDLEAGSYFVQIDGRGGDAGAFSLDVFVMP